MAMNKKESARMEQLLTAAALRATAPVQPDVIVSRDYTISGFLPMGCALGSDPRVEVATSTSVSHKIGTSRNSSGSQGPRNLFSTRLLALRALRHEAEQECAMRLRRIDRMIEAEVLAGQDA